VRGQNQNEAIERRGVLAGTSEKERVLAKTSRVRGRKNPTGSTEGNTGRWKTQKKGRCDKPQRLMDILTIRKPRVETTFMTGSPCEGGGPTVKKEESPQIHTNPLAPHI